MGDLRLLFATDLHGSESAFRKFVNASRAMKVDVAVLGGDLTGKALVPVIEERDGYVADFNGAPQRVSAGEELEELEKTIRLSGQYPFRTTTDEYEHLRERPKEVDAMFHRAMCESLTGWFDLAAERLSPHGMKMVVIAGNDDPFDIDEVLNQHPFVKCVDGDIASFDGVEIIGFGGSNPTPWKSPREFPEEQIERRLRATAERLSDVENSIWNVHVPPNNSGLDTAPEVDSEFRIVRVAGQPNQLAVGSTAVKSLIEEYQPGLGLHGHVHESRALGRIGRSVVVNPGSEYSEGVLRAALVRRHKKKGYQVQVISG